LPLRLGPLAEESVDQFVEDVQARVKRRKGLVRPMHASVQRANVEMGGHTSNLFRAVVGIVGQQLPHDVERPLLVGQ
jgi:hypothetical protein